MKKREPKRNEEIRRLFASGTTARELMAQFGLSRTTIYGITQIASHNSGSLLAEARRQLAREIADAREEAATAPLYRGGPT